MNKRKIPKWNLFKTSADNLAGSCDKKKSLVIRSETRNMSIDVSSTCAKINTIGIIVVQFDTTCTVE